VAYPLLSDCLMPSYVKFQMFEYEKEEKIIKICSGRGQKLEMYK
jgi:hypothetical protein